jgi:NADH dehydrogenase
MTIHIPNTNQQRVVIIGGGFGGLKLAQRLRKLNLQVVLLDKNNYHQFQPLFYQVATAGLEPSTILFPFRRIFQKEKNVFIRLCEVSSIDPGNNLVISSIGNIRYDYLVIAIGADTNFFNNKTIKTHAFAMKSVSEALAIRNSILENYEAALDTTDSIKQQALMNIVVVGGGPTGVEVSGTLAEMKHTILPKDYPELDFSSMQVVLLEASPRLLNGMSDQSSRKAKEYLERLGVQVNLGKSVSDFDGSLVSLADGTVIHSKTLIWAAGVKANSLGGIPAEWISKSNRILVNRFNCVEGNETIFAVGDVALMTEEKYPNGHPQVAQVAIQQGDHLAENFSRLLSRKPLQPFHYKDLGSMATVGRNLAVVDLPKVHFQGFLAWIVWMFVHLMAIIGVKNRIFIFINWAWNYVTYNQSLRLIIRPKKKIS